MNQQLISKYLQTLRKQHGFTQENLAKELSISRQAVSKWETGNTIPDLDILLKLSKLYHITINELLEPNIKKTYIQDFEQLSEVDRNQIKIVLSNFTEQSIVKASMGASPKINDFLVKLLPEINFKLEREKIKAVKIDEVIEIQNEIISLLNLL